MSGDEPSYIIGINFEGKDYQLSVNEGQNATDVVNKFFEENSNCHIWLTYFRDEARGAS